MESPALGFRFGGDPKWVGSIAGTKACTLDVENGVEHDSVASTMPEEDDAEDDDDDDDLSRISSSASCSSSSSSSESDWDFDGWEEMGLSYSSNSLYFAGSAVNLVIAAWDWRWYEREALGLDFGEEDDDGSFLASVVDYDTLRVASSSCFVVCACLEFLSTLREIAVYGHCHSCTVYLRGIFLFAAGAVLDLLTALAGSEITQEDWKYYLPMISSHCYFFSAVLCVSLERSEFTESTTSIAKLGGMGYLLGSVVDMILGYAYYEIFYQYQPLTLCHWRIASSFFWLMDSISYLSVDVNKTLRLLRK